MGKEKEIDQFKLLEEKIDSLIEFVKSLKKEKESLVEKRHIQEEKISVLTEEVESLRATNDRGLSRLREILPRKGVDIIQL